MCYMQVFIINECSLFYFTQSKFVPAFISVIMHWYKILHNDTIEYIFVFQLHTFNFLFASLQLNLAKRKFDKTEVSCLDKVPQLHINHSDTNQ